MISGLPHGKHVLVVDDCSATCEMIDVILWVEGYTVTSAGNGQEALHQLNADPLPDLILLDLAMPVVSGWEFLQQRKQDPRLARIPVVIFSAIGYVPDALSAFGVAGCITKPILEDALIDAVVEAVRALCPSG